MGLVRRYFRQFHFWRAVRLIVAKVAQHLLNPGATSIYAREGEDLIAVDLLGGNVGFYVDVGCNHPIRFSNTFELYRRGWRGLNVDGNAALIDLCRRVRPRDVSVCAVVSDGVRQARFTEFEESTVSTLSPEHLAEWRQHSAIVREREVTTTTLTALLREHDVPSRFDLLSVDVERHDHAVLSSLDFDQFRPALIIVEMLDFRLADRDGGDAVVTLLADRGYELVAFALRNGYFRDVRQARA